MQSWRTYPQGDPCSLGIFFSFFFKCTLTSQLRELFFNTLFKDIQHLDSRGLGSNRWATAMLHFHIHVLILFIKVFWIKPNICVCVKELLKQTLSCCAIFSTSFMPLIFTKLSSVLRAVFFSSFTGMRSCGTGMTAYFTRKNWDSTTTILQLWRRLRVDSIMRFVFLPVIHVIHFVSFYKHSTVAILTFRSLDLFY